MSNYTKSTNFATKDNLSPGDPLKIVRGTEIDTEFNNISTAISTKTDNSAAAITGGSITGITDLAIADGGTGASTATAAINNLLPSQTSNANKYLQTDGTNVSWDAVTLSTADITGTLPVANGGTGITSFGSGVATFLGTPSSANLLAAVTDETGTGSLVFANTPTLVSPILGTPTSGNFSSGSFTWPTFNQNTTGTAAGLSATLAIASGGTGQTTANAAFNALAPSQTSASGKYLKSDGTNTSWDALDISTADITGTLPVANGGTGVTSSTGTGSVVLSNSPTLVTPILGTPQSGNFSTGTFTWPTFNQNTTGTAAGLSATLATTSGGTGLTSFTSGGVVYASSTSALATGSGLTFNGTSLVAGERILVQNNGTITSGFGDGVAVGGWDSLGFLASNTLVLGGYRASQWTGTAFYASATRMMDLTTTGLGIGTSSPTVPLTFGLVLSTAGSANKIRMYDSGAARYGFGVSASQLDYVTGGSHVFYTGGNSPSEAMRIDASQNMGLGVTPSIWTTGKALELGTVGNSVWGLGSSNMVVGSNMYLNGTFKYANTAAATYYQQSGGVHYWHNAPSGTAGTTATFTQAMTLDASGNLMVGGTTNTGGLKIMATDGTVQTGFLPYASNSVAYAGTWTNHAFAFTTNGAERARIDSSGNFLVGTTDASVSTGAGFKVLGGRPIVTNAQSTDGGATVYEAYSTGAGAYRFYVGMGGTVFATSIVISAISDQRLKENVRDIETGLDAIMALKPRRFDWKENKGQDKKNVAGFIAQEFENVFPECVGVSRAGEDGIEYKNINHETLIPTLVKAMQEQQAIIESLKARLDATNL